MSNKHLALVVIALLAATTAGCRSERAGSADSPEAHGIPPVPAHVDQSAPEVGRCTDEILPELMGQLGFQVLRSEPSRAGCVVLLEAFDAPELVSTRVTEAAALLGYDLDRDDPAKGGRRLVYSSRDGLEISILMRGEGPVTMQNPDARSHLELHWYNPNLL